MTLRKDPIIKKAFIILIASLIFITSIVVLSNYFFINRLRIFGANIDSGFGNNFIYE